MMIMDSALRPNGTRSELVRSTGRPAALAAKRPGTAGGSGIARFFG